MDIFNPGNLKQSVGLLHYFVTVSEDLLTWLMASYTDVSWVTFRMMYSSGEFTPNTLTKNILLFTLVPSGATPGC